MISCIIKTLIELYCRVVCLSTVIKNRINDDYSDGKSI